MSKQIFKSILVVLAIVAVLAIVNVAPAQATDNQRAVVYTNLTLAQLDVVAIDAIDVVKNHGAVGTATAFGGQGSVSQVNHRLAISTQRSIANRFVMPTISNIARAERQDFTHSLKPFVLKLPPESPRQPKRFRFTPLTRSIAGARDAVIH